MQKILKPFIASMALVLASAAAMAADSPELRLKAANRYLEVVPMAKMMEDSYSEMAKQVPADKREQFVAHMRKGVRVDALEKIARDSMVKVFTADELNALADFYGSTHGASAMKKFGVYMGNVMPAIQQEVQQAMQRSEPPKK